MTCGIVQAIYFFIPFDLIHALTLEHGSYPIRHINKPTSGVSFKPPASGVTFFNIAAAASRESFKFIGALGSCDSRALTYARDPAINPCKQVNEVFT